MCGKNYETQKLLYAKQPTAYQKSRRITRITSISDFQTTRFHEGRFTFHFLLGSTFSGRFWKNEVALPPSLLSLLLPI